MPTRLQREHEFLYICVVLGIFIILHYSNIEESVSVANQLGFCFEFDGG